VLLVRVVRLHSELATMSCRLCARHDNLLAGLSGSAASLRFPRFPGKRMRQAASNV